MATTSAPDRPWYEEAFNQNYLAVYAHRGQTEAEDQADAILDRLGAGAGARLLDVGCGEGRYARAFARRGVRVTGIDWSRDLLEEGRERGRLLPGAPVYVRLDMRALPYHRQFDAAVSLFTSFGYFDTEAGDLQTLEGIRRALVPGGRFLLDFLNEAHVRSALVPEDERVHGDLRLVMKRRIDDDAPGGPRVIKDVAAFDVPTGLPQFTYQERVMLYTRDDVDRLITQAGLELVGEPLGDVHGAPFDAMADRLVRVAEKPSS